MTGRQESVQQIQGFSQAADESRTSAPKRSLLLECKPQKLQGKDYEADATILKAIGETHGPAPRWRGSCKGMLEWHGEEGIEAGGLDESRQEDASCHALCRACAWVSSLLQAPLLLQHLMFLLRVLDHKRPSWRGIAKEWSWARWPSS
eukprot:5517550-Amphidinium_carterae.1